MGGVPSAPLPVTLPNDLDLRPGEKAELWYYDAAPFPGVPAGWRLAGEGTVSSDGQRIVSDPDVGIQRFCGVCGLVCWVRRQAGEAFRNLFGLTGGEPVDLATGLFSVDKTDLILPGRLPITLSRHYHPVDPFTGIAGFQAPLGPGWYLSVDAILLEVTPSLFRLVLPGNARLDLVRQPDGTYRNSTHPSLSGAVLTAHPGGEHQLRFKDGTTWRFRNIFLGLEFLIEQVDRNGNRITIGRTFRGRANRIEAGGRVLFINGGSRIEEVLDPLGRTVQYGYDAAGRLSTVTDPEGGVTRYTYDGAGRITSITDPRGIVFVQNGYSPGTGRVLRQTQADGGVWRFRYLLQGATVSGPGCPGPSCPTEESIEQVAQGYTFSGGVIVATTVVDARGSATTTRFAPGGFTRETVDALGQTTRFERNAAGNLLSTTDPLGRVTRYSYDVNGNVTSITDPAGNIRTFTYEMTFNRPTSFVDPLGNRTTFEYDLINGNLLKTTDALGNVTQIAYNEFGQAVSTTDALGKTATFAYDTVGNLTTLTDPLGNTLTRTYDAVSRLIAETNPLGKTAKFSYDDLNRLTQIVDALNGQTTFTYDANGNTVSVTDARGSTTRYEYDSMDRRSGRIDPLGQSESLTYDGNGNLLSITDRKGGTTTSTHDPLDRVVQTGFADGVVARFVYDAGGRTAMIDDPADPHGPTTLAYDLLDRVTSETTSLAAVSYTYDRSGRRTSMTLGGQAPVTYAYDAASRLRTITQEALPPVELQHDALGRRTRLTLPNSVSTEYQYDAASRLTALVYSNALSLLGNLSFEYDAAGNKIGVGGSFARTLFPNAVPSATYDAANRQLAFGDRSMTYDANGNLTTITEPAGVTTFTWDGRSRLVSLSGPGVIAAFGYGDERRRSRTVNGRTTQAFHDRSATAQEMTDGSPIDYLNGPGIDEPLVRNGGEYYLADDLGSVISLTDASGALTTRYTYEPFGRSTVEGVPSANPFQYTGREDDGTGLYYYRARYYSPLLHRFINEDPLRFAGGDWNLYAYVRGNPLRFLDPFGLELTGIAIPTLTGPGAGWFDTTVVERVQSIVTVAQTEGIPITLHETFRTTAQQAYYQKIIGTGGVGPVVGSPLTSRHTAGFAFDTDWSKLSPTQQARFVEIAKQYGFEQLQNLRLRELDPSHFEADPTKYEYRSNKAAVDRNQEHWRELRQQAHELHRAGERQCLGKRKCR